MHILSPLEPFKGVATSDAGPVLTAIYTQSRDLAYQHIYNHE